MFSKPMSKQDPTKRSLELLKDIAKENDWLNVKIIDNEKRSSLIINEDTVINSFVNINLGTNKITEIGLHEFLKSFIEEINFVYKKFEQKYFFGVEI